MAFRDAAIVLIVEFGSRSADANSAWSSSVSLIHTCTDAAVFAVSVRESFHVPDEIDGLSPGFEPGGGAMFTWMTPVATW